MKGSSDKKLCIGYEDEDDYYGSERDDDYGKDGLYGDEPYDNYGHGRYANYGDDGDD